MRVLAAILLLLVGSGCERAPVEPGMFFPTWSPEGAVPTGIVQGVLVREDRCLFVEGNRERTLVVWEEGLGFDGDALLSFAGAPIAHLGETIHGGGGYFSDRGHMERLAQEAIPDRCVPSGSDRFALIYEVAAGPFG